VFVSAAWIGPAILAAFETYVQGRLGNRPPATWRSMLWEGGDWLVYSLLTPCVFLVARSFPLERGRIGRRLPLHGLAAVVLCAGWASGGILLRWLLFSEAEIPYARGWLGWFFTSLPFGVAVYFAVLGVEHAVHYFLEARERETQAARLEAQLSEARLGALRMQMQPHFLLNTLNAITVVARDEGSAKVTRLLEELGELLRRVLRADRPAEVALRDELDFVRRYLALEELRFSDRLRPVFAIDERLLGAAVPEFVLQPLVENALRHGLAKRVEATRLELAARREGESLVLEVRDDGPGPSPESPRPEGVGLANTRARLATLYGARASLTLAPTAGGGALASVRLPLRFPPRAPEAADG
jgi:signal transduction histidine kinase